MILHLVISAAYLYFHCRYFMLIDATFERSKSSRLWVIITFFLNYALFYICSILQLNLIINWIVFFIFLFLETIIYCMKSCKAMLFFALSGILFGLSINILCRCLISIILNDPLSMFDNHVLSNDNLKEYPVFAGFLLGGVALHLMAVPRSVHRLRTLIAHPDHLAFQLDLMTVLFVYLTLNLLLYQSHGNILLLKIWGIKSCVFSLAGFGMALRYSLKMCRLSDYREENHTIQHQLMNSEQKEVRLRTIAYKDALTGTYNRLYALNQLETYIQQGKPFTLCFIDLDDLKGVNDRHGHGQGDRYIIAAANKLMHAHREEKDLLARFGGDEFLLVFQEMNTSTAEQRLTEVNQSLQAMSVNEGLPFSMSISYGLVESDDYDSIDALIDAADDAMYQNKMQNHKKI